MTIMMKKKNQNRKKKSKNQNVALEKTYQSTEYYNNTAHKHIQFPNKINNDHNSKHTCTQHRSLVFFFTANIFGALSDHLLMALSGDSLSSKRRSLVPSTDTSYNWYVPCKCCTFAATISFQFFAIFLGFQKKKKKCENKTNSTIIDWKKTCIQKSKTTYGIKSPATSAAVLSGSTARVQ